MDPSKLPKPCSPTATEAQQQPPPRGSTESWDTSACSQAPSAPRRVSSPGRTSTSSQSAKSCKKSTSRRTSEGAALWCMVLMAETYPPRQAVYRKDVPKADKATQSPSSFEVLQKEWLPQGEKKKENKYTSDDQDQPQQRASRASSATESCSQASQRRAPSPPEAAVTAQNRKSMSSLCVNLYNEEGEEQDEAVLELEEKQVNVGEVKSHLHPVEIHLPDQTHREAREDVAVDGVTVDIHDADSNMGTTEVPLANEDLQEALGHTAEDAATVDNQGSDLTMVETHLTPEPQDVLSLVAVDSASPAAIPLSLPRPEISLESQSLLLARYPASFKYYLGPTLGYKGDTQDLRSILGSVATAVPLTSKEKLEALGHMEGEDDGKVNPGESVKTVRLVQQPPLGEEDKVNVSGEGSILATPQIHSNPEKLKEAKVNERVAPSPGSAPKTRVTPKPLPKKRVIKPLPREAPREPSCIPQQRIECKAAKTMTRKQRKAFSNAFNLFPKDPDGNINLHSLEVTAKQLGISLTSQEAYGELVRADADGDRTVDFSDFLDIITDKKHFTQTISPGKNDSGSFNSVDAKGILLFKVFLKLVELAALPRRTLFQIMSYYEQKLRDCTGQKVWLDGDFLKCHRKKPHKIQKKPVYPMPAFVSAAHVSAMNKRDKTAYREHLKGSPYAQVPIFPLICKQDAMTLAKPRKGLQKVARQRNEPTALFASHFSRDRNRVQEAAALKPPAHYRKQRRSPAVNTECPNTSRHLTTDSPGKTQTQAGPPALPPAAAREGGNSDGHQAKAKPQRHRRPVKAGQRRLGLGLLSPRCMK
ncbi:EF-hand calcium-binding domain-containing protein 3 isoform X1 [Accipiter gentilis]|uniref:EF-hand calcium-binding domain-containing protein 3 isoform X1 n=1 Tax=Astur gentilis TaxID=8957 RepID=UPI002110A718|nr:EF-hand calcium-binding domain-containing protein 3 isoform X1 [Accipiter gentilis]